MAVRRGLLLVSALVILALGASIGVGTDRVNEQRAPAVLSATRSPRPHDAALPHTPESAAGAVGSRSERNPVNRTPLGPAASEGSVARVTTGTSASDADPNAAEIGTATFDGRAPPVGARFPLR